jgi:hypothetical protein
LQASKQASVKKSRNLPSLTACTFERVYRLSRNVGNKLPSTLRNIAEDRRSHKHEVTWGLRMFLYNNFTLFRATHRIYRTSGLITVWRYSNKTLFFVAEIPFESFFTASRQDDAQESFGHHRQEWADTEEGEVLAILRESPQGSVTFSPCKQYWEAILTSDFWLIGYNCTELKLYWR